MKHLLRALLTGLLWAADASAQGIVLERIVPEPPTPAPSRFPIRLKEHRVKITVREQVAQVEVVQIFANPNPWEMEGIYLFPLPEGAAVSSFTMRMGDKDVAGEILDAQRAREIYRSIVHRRADPGLLEFAGRGLLRASLFPIPARGDTRISLRYAHVLELEAGLVELVAPLKSDAFAPGPVAISGEIDVEASAGVATLFSPTHRLDVARKGDTRVVAAFEESASAADRDLRVLYGLGRKDFGLSLVSHKPAGEDGYFLLLLAPRAEFKAEDVLPKDVVFAVDTSGSMGERGGRKMEQAKAAMRYALGRLHERDRFHLVAFSTEARPFRDGLLPATRENVDAAIAHVDALVATGGTAIHDALLASLAIPPVEGRVPIVIFLTDGQPTVGPTDVDTILRAAEAANRARARLFVFGVGDDLNATLLTELADKNRGTGHFVSEREDIELKVSSLVDQVAAPVLTDVTIKIAGAEEYDLYPRQPGDLFHGQQALVVGRYRKPGPRAITLTGRVGARELSFVHEAAFRDAAGEESLPRLWAVRKVGFLLAEIRRNGERGELVDEVKRLGIRYGIVTPYTSFLAAEEREILLRGIAAGVDGPSPWVSSAIGAAGERKALADVVGEALRAQAPSGGGAVAGAR
ncbi:MAG: VIT and vWA domain-containing protein, partial [Planctomycetota bacterium]